MKVSEWSRRSRGPVADRDIKPSNMPLGSGTRVERRELKSWHLIVVLAVVLAIDVAWLLAAW